MDKVYTIEEVSDIINAPVELIVMWLERRTVRGMKHGETWFIKEYDLLDFMRQAKNKDEAEKQFIQMVYMLLLKTIWELRTTNIIPIHDIKKMFDDDDLFTLIVKKMPYSIQDAIRNEFNKVEDEDTEVVENTSEVQNNSKVYINAHEAAEYLNVTISVIHTLCKKRSFPAVKLGNSWNINKNGLDEWFLKQARTKQI